MLSSPVNEYRWPLHYATIPVDKLSEVVENVKN